MINVLGLMSGTSCDGLDCCDVNIGLDENYNSHYHINDFRSIPYTKDEKNFLLSTRNNPYKKNNTEENQLSTMNLLLLEANTGEVSDAIRDEIDEDFAKEMNSEDKFGFEWEDEQEVLDAVKESERIREKNFNNESITEGDVPIKKQKVKRKKKKRFFIF